jgi:hypothetical protein
MFNARPPSLNGSTFLPSANKKGIIISLSVLLILASSWPNPQPWPARREGLPPGPGRIPCKVDLDFDADAGFKSRGGD